MRTQPHCGAISRNTLTRMIREKYDCSFEELRVKKAGVFRAKILLKQAEVALQHGNVTLLIWLGKQYCGQSDTPEPPDGETPDTYPEPEISDEVTKHHDDDDDDEPGDPTPATGTPAPTA